MAIFSLSHNPVGRSTHAAGTAGAHARYVTRDGAASLILGEHMPTGRESSQAWLDAQEAADRKNARVIDKVMVALPVELDAAERAQLVRDFAGEVGGGRIAWLAGVHDRGEDAHNPHAHVIFRDRDIETGKRSVGLSEKGSTDRLREIWEQVANQALERAGLDVRIDRRSLEAQGIDRQAGIHIGPNVLAMEERGVRPSSRPQEVDGRVIDWPSIDQGRTRLDRQAEIEAANDNREQEREKGKDKGRGDFVPAGNAQQAPAREVDALKQIQEHQRQAVVEPTKVPARVVAQASPEATQRPSYVVENRTLTSELAQKPEITADRHQEASRLRQAIGRARERLEALGNRLEIAFARIRNPFDRRRQIESGQVQPEPKETGPDKLRRTLRPELTKHPEFDSLGTDHERQAAFLVTSGIARSGLNPTVFSDGSCRLPQT